MKKVLYFLLPSFFLCLLVLLGYWAGAYNSARKFDQTVRWVEKGETLTGALSVTPLSPEQQDYRKAYDAPVDASTISWSVPNQPTPFVGTAPVPGQHHNAYLNSWQMRNQEELIIPKPTGIYRIFLTGGSTAFGSGAPSQDKTIGNLLASLLNKDLSPQSQIHYEVFTFANPAWSSSHERIAIENYLSELEPDLVISLSGNNDVFWGNAGRNILWFSTLSDEYFQSLINTAYVSSGRKSLAELPHTHPHSEPIPPKTVAQRLEKNIRLGAESLQLIHRNWIFFLQPTLSATQKKLTSREKAFLNSSKDYYAECYALISKNLSQVNLSNFRFVDLSTLFDQEQHSDKDIFLDQFHFGDRGNLLIANAIYKTISNLGENERVLNQK